MQAYALNCFLLEAIEIFVSQIFYPNLKFLEGGERELSKKAELQDTLCKTPYVYPKMQ